MRDIQALLASGSSPRVRGTCLEDAMCQPVPGLIPAGAGNMSHQTTKPGGYGAHPRGCGEHEELKATLPAGVGSSPRVRGTWSRTLSFIHPIGLIPAGAGNIRYVVADLCTTRTHPRGCGEHASDFAPLRWKRGSSPRVRGTSNTIERRGDYLGLIPAGAGNILEHASTAPQCRAHPRGCGEHLIYLMYI